MYACICICVCVYVCVYACVFLIETDLRNYFKRKNAHTYFIHALLVLYEI